MIDVVCSARSEIPKSEEVVQEGLESNSPPLVVRIRVHGDKPLVVRRQVAMVRLPEGVNFFGGFEFARETFTRGRKLRVLRRDALQLMQRLASFVPERRPILQSFQMGKVRVSLS